MPINSEINFALNQPCINDLPLEYFNKALSNIINMDNPEILSSVTPNKTKLASWLSKKYETDVLENQLYMTNGNINSIQLLMDVYMESGDEIIVEEPICENLKNIFEQYGLNINYVPLEDDGINIKILEEKIKYIIENDDRNLQNKIFLYTIPMHHNPTSITLSHQKREKLANLCSRYDKFFVIADEAYQFLNFNEKNIFYPLAYYHSKIFSLGSFSKIIGPNLKVGWIYQNRKDYDLIERLNKMALLKTGGSLNPLGFIILEEMMDSMNELLANTIESIKTKCNIMNEFITINFKDVKFKKPQGGTCFWLKLNIDDSSNFLKFAETRKVKFYPGPGGYIRLSFSYYEMTDMISGLVGLLEAYNLYSKTKVSTTTTFESNKFHFFKELNEAADIIIEISNDELTFNLLNNLFENKINKPLIISCDLSKKTIQLIKMYAFKNPVAIVSDFSMGLNKVKKLLNDLEDNFFQNKTDINSFLKVESNQEEILLWVPWLLEKTAGLYYEMEDSMNLEKTVFGTKFLITEDEKYNKKVNVDNVLLLTIDDKNYNWDAYDQYGNETKANGNDLLAIVKYLNKMYKITSGKLNNKNSFKIDGTKNYIELSDPPSTIELSSEESKSLKNVINQLSGLNVLGTGKYELDYNYLIIEIKEDLDTIDSEILTTLGSIITEDVYQICFVNIKDKTIRSRFYDKTVGREVDGLLFGCVAVFDYYAFVNELSYDNPLDGFVILNNDIIKIIYNLEKYFICSN